MDYHSIKALAELLKPPENSSDSEDESQNRGIQKLGPADLIPRVTKELKPQDGGYCPWRPIPKTAEPTEEDPRKEPNYTIRYRQEVAPEDVYLGSNGKTSGAGDYDFIIIDFDMNGEEKDNIDLDVTEEKLEVNGVKFRATVALPQKVERDSGRAIWNADQHSLQISLKVKKREQ